MLVAECASRKRKGGKKKEDLLDVHARSQRVTKRKGGRRQENTKRKKKPLEEEQPSKPKFLNATPRGQHDSATEKKSLQRWQSCPLKHISLFPEKKKLQ
jgi:hypothetical protein